MAGKPASFLLLSLTAASVLADPGAVVAHSYAETDKVRVRAMALELTVDFERKALHGHVEAQLEWLDPAHGYLRLDTRALHIEEVRGGAGDGGWQRLEFELGEPDPVLGSRLSIEMPGPLEYVRVAYRTGPGATALQWLEPSMTSSGRHPFLFSQSQAIHARSWVPLQDTPAVRFTYDARITAPPGLRVLMAARLEEADAERGVHRFRMPERIPAYLLAIAVGELEFRPLGERIGVWAEPELVEAAAEEFADTGQMMAQAEALYGPYRWGRYDLLVLPPSFPLGGMENPRLTFITPTLIVGDRSLTGLVAHELAHSWSGNLVTNARWEDAWLNEGFTTYVENRIVEAVYGHERAVMEAIVRRSTLKKELGRIPPQRQRLVLPVEAGSNPDELFSAVAYAKGAWFLQFLEQRLGRQRFDVLLREWFDAHAFQSATSADFVAFLRNAGAVGTAATAGVSESELHSWLHEPGVPDFAPQLHSERFQAVDTLRTRWLRKDRLPEELRELPRRWGTHEWQHFLDGLPARMETAKLAELDEAFALSGTPNGEIAQRWYALAERSGYMQARPAMAEFLVRVGRRKLIRPIYEALAATEDGREFARRVFARARPGYHPRTVVAVEALLAVE